MLQVFLKNFFSFYRDATGKFPEYPEEEDGGSAMIFQVKDPAELEAELKAKVCHFSFQEAHLV